MFEHIIASALEDEFDASGATQATRSVLPKLTDTLFTRLGMDALNDESKRALRASVGATDHDRVAPGRAATSRRARQARACERRDREIQTMMQAMYRKFAAEHGLRLAAPQGFSLLRFQKQFDRVERAFQVQFDTVYTMRTDSSR